MKIISYSIELLEPVLVTALDGDPNSAVSFDYLPGGALRGAIIGRYLVQQQSAAGNFDAAAETVRRLFLDGRTRYLNGYLGCLTAASQQVRTLPLPRSLFVDKGTRDPLYDFAGDAHPRQLQQPKAYPGDFGYFEAGMLYDAQVRRRISVHTARNRRFGRARGGSAADELTGAIYRYDALAPGQTFIAAILCQDGDADLLAGLLDGLAMLGGSRSAGYGQVRLSRLDGDPQDAQTWNETAYRVDQEPHTAALGNDEISDGDPPQLPADRLIITLLSDVALRDAGGHYSVDPHAVCRELDLTLLDTLAFSARRPDGGFNRKWGLPTPQMPVFARGSVFVCAAPGEHALAALQKKRAAGIGERRAEGFGRFAIDYYHGDELHLAPEQEPVQPQPFPLPGGSGARAAAEQMVGRLLDQRIDRYITAEATALATERQHGLQKSQIYRLQQQILTSLQDPRLDLGKDRKRIERYLDSLQKRAVTRKQFVRTRVAGQTIPGWIESLLEKNDGQELRDAVKQFGEIKQIGDVEPQIGAELIYRTNLRLINATLARFAKLARDD